MLVAASLACSPMTSTADAGEVCPSTPPSDGAPCPPPGPLACEYGDPASCLILAACGSDPANMTFHWNVSQEPGCGGNPSACPATFADALAQKGGACTLDGGVCGYPEGRCGCEGCLDDAGAATTVLNCTAFADLGATCAARPKLGDSCDADGATCDFGECCTPPSLGPSMQCSGGRWVSFGSGACKCAPPACP